MPEQSMISLFSDSLMRWSCTLPIEDMQGQRLQIREEHRRVSSTSQLLQRSFLLFPQSCPFARGTGRNPPFSSDLKDSRSVDFADIVVTFNLKKPVQSTRINNLTELCNPTPRTSRVLSINLESYRLAIPVQTFEREKNR